MNLDLNPFEKLRDQTLINSAFLKEHTSDEINSTENLPLYFERFIIDYLEPKNFLDIDNPEEIVQLIQHFGYWLFTNNYTKYRISLVNLNIPL